MFKNILNYWSLMITQEQPSDKLTKLSHSVINAFYCWIKIKLSPAFFANLVNEHPHLFKLLIAQFASQKYDNIEIAAKCLVELL